MMRRLAALCFGVALTGACSSSHGDVTQPDAMACCPPSPQPECCMQLGGWMLDGVCPPLTCDIPSPTAPGWTLWTDSHGCTAWRAPSGPHGCGPGPVFYDAGPRACAPQDVSGYTPPALTPPRPHVNACSYVDLQDYYGACVAQATTSSACLSFQQAHPTCVQCVASQMTDAQWGPIVWLSPSSFLFNITGCIALVTHDSSAGSCAQRANDTFGCESAACDSVCPVVDAASVLAYEQCAQEADVGGCRSYLDAECDPADAGFSQCLLDPLDGASFATFASPFCGP